AVRLFPATPRTNPQAARPAPFRTHPAPAPRNRRAAAALSRRHASRHSPHQCRLVLDRPGLPHLPPATARHVLLEHDTQHAHFPELPGAAVRPDGAHHRHTQPHFHDAGGVPAHRFWATHATGHVDP